MLKNEEKKVLTKKKRLHHDINERTYQSEGSKEKVLPIQEVQNQIH